jgi:hypothetical protein
MGGALPLLGISWYGGRPSSIGDVLIWRHLDMETSRYGDVFIWSALPLLEIGIYFLVDMQERWTDNEERETIVITDPSDSRFDLEAYLQQLAADDKKAHA